MDEITYRRATADDIVTLVELRMAFLHESNRAAPDPAALRQALERYFAESIPAGEFVAFLAGHNDAVIATSGLVFQRRPPWASSLSGLTGYIMNMYTRKEYRRRGIGTKLLRLLIDHARATNCRRVSLHAADKARAMYERLGFEAEESMMRLDLKADG